MRTRKRMTPSTAIKISIDDGRLRGGRQGIAPGNPLAFAMQLPYAGGGKGRPRPLYPRPGAFAPGNPLAFAVQLPYAGGGKGRPRPLHPRPGALPLGTPI